MEQYAGQALNYANHYLTTIKQWWWPPQQTLPQSPVQQLRFYLTNSNIEFQTKHSDRKIIIERLCMMFNQLLTGEDKKYANFKPSISVPVQYVYPKPASQPTIPNNNTTSSSDSSQQQYINKSIVSISGQLKIKSQKIKCSLLVTLVLHEQIQDSLPFIYIRNPDTYKTQPNHEFISSKIYDGILGGVGLSQKQLGTLANLWKQYKVNNMVNIIKHIEKLLQDYFPFVKRYKTFEQTTIQSQQYKKMAILRKELKEKLVKTQQLIILNFCIQSQQNYLNQQNKKIKEILQKNQQQQNKYDIDRIISMFKVESHEELLDLLCRERACVDVLRLLQNQAEFGNKSIQEFHQNLEAVKEWSGKLFEIRFKLVEVISMINKEQ